MKIALLHGAIKNAGDFLIKNRAIDLLKKYYSDCEIKEYYRNQSLEDKLDEINQSDILILAGGPGYYNDFYPKKAPFVSELDKIKIPIAIMGMGWFGNSSSVDTVYSYPLNGKMGELLSRVSNDTKMLGCRDYYSVNVLRNNGFDGGLMTGCPAWYDLDKVQQVNYTGPKLGEIQKICVSDCGNIDFYPLAVELLEFMRNLFPKGEIVFVCHRNDVIDQFGIREYLEGLNIKIVNIANSAQGFAVYDDCDLHVGFRVHAHIYNLSARKLSVLIEEDGRGAGVNDALGLPNICAYKMIIMDNKLIKVENKQLNYQIEDYLLNLEACDNTMIELAFERMRRAYGQMEKFILSIKNWVKTERER